MNWTDSIKILTKNFCVEFSKNYTKSFYSSITEQNPDLTTDIKLLTKRYLKSSKKSIRLIGFPVMLKKVDISKAVMIMVMILSMSMKMEKLFLLRLNHLHQTKLNL